MHSVTGLIHLFSFCLLQLWNWYLRSKTRPQGVTPTMMWNRNQKRWAVTNLLSTASIFTDQEWRSVSALAVYNMTNQREKRCKDSYTLDQEFFSHQLINVDEIIHSRVFFFLTGLHFFHLVVGLLLLSLLFWSCSL